MIPTHSFFQLNPLTRKSYKFFSLEFNPFMLTPSIKYSRAHRKKKLVFYNTIYCKNLKFQYKNLYQKFFCSMILNINKKLRIIFDNGTELKGLRVF